MIEFDRSQPVPANEWAVDGRQLRALRHERAVSQQQLASLSGVRQQHISNMERRQTHARLGTVVRLADALGVQPVELVVGREALPELPLRPTSGAAPAGEAVVAEVARLTDRLEEFGTRLEQARQMLDELSRAQRELRQTIFDVERLVRQVKSGSETAAARGER